MEYENRADGDPLFAQEVKTPDPPTTGKSPASLASAWRTPGRWLRTNALSPGLARGLWGQPVVAYLAAALLPCALVGLTMPLLHFFSTFAFPAILFILGLVCVALFWGTGPGLLATFISTVLLNVFILPPHFSFSFNTVEDIVETVLFLVVGILICLVVGQVELARQRIEALVGDLQSEREALRRDVAGRQRVEEALRRTDEQYRSMVQVANERASQLEATFEAMTDIVLVYDREGMLMHSNTAARQFNALIEQPDYTARPAAERYRVYEFRDEQGQVLQHQHLPVFRILQGEVLTSTNAEDVKISLPGGREVQLSVTGAPIRDEAGQLLGAVIVCRDVTERRALERRVGNALDALLVMAEELVKIPERGEQVAARAGTASTGNPVAHQLAELICSVLGCRRVSITAIDPETGALRSEAVVGVPPEVEREWRERHPGTSLSEQLASTDINERLLAGEALVLDWRQPPLRDLPNPYGISTMLLAPMKVSTKLVGVLALDYGGKEHLYTQYEIAVTGAVAKLGALVIERERLVQERAQAQVSELAMREANRRMDEFLGIASHELKTPLTTIKIGLQLAQRQFTRLLKQETGLPEEVARKFAAIEELLERGERQVGVQDRLVNDLLDVSRINANRLQLQPELCDLMSIVREAVEDQRSISPTRTIRLEVEVEEAVVQADPGRLGQVVNNYLSNAIKYSEADRPVDVCVKKEDALARIEVRDYGPGLSPQEQKRIWERFYRAEGVEVKSGSGVGLGLGLYICRSIIERQGGRVGVRSKPGQGSTFWFTMPLVESGGS